MNSRRRINRTNNRNQTSNRKKRNTNLIKEPSPITLSLPSVRSGFPDRFRTTVIYSDLIQLNPLQPFRNQVFRGNSLYDPDFTALGHQPLYFDQYMAIYERFRVLGSKIIIKVVNNSPGSSAIAVLHADTDPLAVVSFFPISEQPHTKISRFIPVSARLPVSLGMRKSSCEILGLSSAQIWDDDYSGTASGNPTKMWYYNVYVQTSDFTQNIQAQLEVTIHYDVVFSDRIYAKESVSILSDISASREHQNFRGESLPPVVNSVQVAQLK